MYLWILNRDAPTDHCKRCQALNGTYSVSPYFLYPGTTDTATTPPLHHGCQCTVERVDEDIVAEQGDTFDMTYSWPRVQDPEVWRRTPLQLISRGLNALKSA
jgi:hypothetical protein